MRIERNCYEEDKRLNDESIFSCASGNLGIRGCFEEGAPDNSISIRGTYVNGFCEKEKINYNEQLYGFPSEKQTIVNLPDSQGIEVFVDGEKISCYSAKANNYRFVLDMENALTQREFIFQTNKGDLKLNFKRMSSFVRPGLFLINCKIESLSFNGSLLIKSSLIGDVKNFTVADDPRVASGSGKMLEVKKAENIIVENTHLSSVVVETINGKRKMSVLVKNDFSGEGKECYIKDGNTLVTSKEVTLKEGETLTLTKYCFYKEIVNDELPTDLMLDILKESFDQLKLEQTNFMNAFWDSSRIIIDSNEIKQEDMDFALYELLSSAGRDGKASVAAKGLSGEGYEGHYFWDCEIYVYPFFLFTNPQIAKSLLEYRYDKLDYAKKHARLLGHQKGALYPWRTIEGSECSSHYPSGSAQYHINGDIAKAFIDYYDVTNDETFLPKICEVLLQTARLWLDAGHYDDGLFKIDCVTGPDEYTCLVNNNYYTNAGAANNLRNATRLINILKNTNEYEEFKKKTALDEQELVDFVDAANKMYLPYDEKLGIIKQDDSFLNKKKVDLSSYPKKDFPLLLHYHPLYLYRHQVCKQADAVLADYLFVDLDASTSMKTYEYYDSVTTHDSSLSKCIFGIVAAKLGSLKLAKQQFSETLATDLNDKKGNTRDGLHIANLGGCYRMISDGFAGLKVKENSLSLFPMLPEGFNSYSFKLTYKGTRILIKVDERGTTLSTNSAEAISIKVYGQDINVSKEEVLIQRKCQAVIFDLDGVITDTACYHYQAWKKIADELKIDFDEIKNENFKGVSRKKCLELLLEWGNIKVSDDVFNEILVRKNEYYKNFLKLLTPANVLPGIKDAIDKLHKNNIKVALFSVSKNTDTIIDQLQIRDLFDVIVSGKDITNSKPHYEGYLLAADRLKIDPRLCAMVEDSSAGILGAKALSMKTVAIMKENVAGANVCISSTKELDRLIDYL